MEESEVLQYVQSAARVAGLALDAQRCQAVAQHFARTIAIARVLEAVPLEPGQEPAEIFRPAPFPEADPA